MCHKNTVGFTKKLPSSSSHQWGRKMGYAPHLSDMWLGKNLRENVEKWGYITQLEDAQIFLAFSKPLGSIYSNHRKALVADLVILHQKVVLVTARSLADQYSPGRRNLDLSNTLWTRMWIEWDMYIYICTYRYVYIDIYIGIWMILAGTCWKTMKLFSFGHRMMEICWDMSQKNGGNHNFGHRECHDFLYKGWEAIGGTPDLPSDNDTRWLIYGCIKSLVVFQSWEVHLPVSSGF